MRLRLSVMVVVSTLAGCAQPPAPVPLGAGPEWEAVGISAHDGETYAKLGMSPLSAKDLKDSGMTPDMLQQWESLKPATFGSPFSEAAPVDTFLAAQKAGIVPSEIAPLVSAGLPLTDAKVVLDAVNLSRAGYSPTQSVDYAQKGVTPDEVADYKRQQEQQLADARAVAAQAEAARQAAAAREAQAAAIIAAKCPAGVQSGEDMLQMSPFTIEGKCFSIGSLPISQWESATEAMVLVLETPIDIETDTPISGQIIPSGLYLGEPALQYQAVSGAASTAYKLHYIGPDPR